MKITDNLKAAFEGESKAYFRYLAFSRAAEKEGKAEIARLFRAVAQAEAIHALNHFEVLGEAHNSEQNLMAAIDGETYEFTQMYPAFIEQAEKEGDPRAANSFRSAMKVEKIHGGLFNKAMENLDSEVKTTYHICSICGNTIEGELPGKCAVCGAAADKFKTAE